MFNAFLRSCGEPKKERLLVCVLNGYAGDDEDQRRKSNRDQVRDLASQRFTH
jgi:hypothetical protein